MSRGRLVFVFGSRPEAIKIAPVVAELAGRAQVTVIATGQHTDLLRGTPAETDLAGALHLSIPAHPTWDGWVAEMQGELEMALREMVPVAAVVVQGDTMSALAGARAAHALHLPVAHIESGLRSHDLQNPWPEEGIRREITTLADWHYAPTKTSVSNLLAEGIAEKAIHRTGNTVVSALARYATLEHCPTPDPRILITLHRREFLNRGHFHVLQTMDALFEAADQYPLVGFAWPAHPSLVALVGDLPHGPPNFAFLPPLPYWDTIETLRTSLGLITDSGGLQEEAATLGVPCIVLRHATDRPESVLAGVTGLAAPDAFGMTDAIRRLLGSKLAARTPDRRPSPCFGTPQAAANVAHHLASLT